MRHIRIVAADSESFSEPELEQSEAEQSEPEPPVELILPSERDVEQLVAGEIDWKEAYEPSNEHDDLDADDFVGFAGERASRDSRELRVIVGRQHGNRSRGHSRRR